MATVTTDELTYVSFPITKWDKTDEGDLVVYGKATDGSLDSDDQVVSPEWSGPALKTWIETGGNVRVQHQALRDPAGKGISVEIDRDGDGGHWVKSLVVEPVAKRLVEKGVLTAYSVGIARPVVKRDPTGKARGGIVAGGHLAELSLVDRPANKACGFILGKADKAGALELTGEMFGDEDVLAKAVGDETDMLFKQGSGDDGDGDANAAPASDADDGDDGATGDGGDDAANTDDSDPDDDDGQDGDDAVSKADGATRLAYKAERQDWLGHEPSVKGAHNGTEYLAKRAEWMRWHADGEAAGLTGTRQAAEVWLSKRDFSAGQRRSAASSGAAMPDGSFPIKNGGDLDNAIHLAGHAKNPDAARAHIKRRAAAIGQSHKIPDSWKLETVPAPEALAGLIGKGLVAAGTALAMLGEETFKAANPDGTVGDNSSNFGSGKKPCPTCHGDGKIMGNNRTCPDCNGSGQMTAKTGGTAQDEVEQPEAVKGSKDCTGCGKSYDADTGYQYCANCGKKLPSAGKTAKRARKAAERADREAAIAGLTATVLKSVEAGLISREAGDEIIAEAAVAALGKKRQVPADVAMAKPHREPDGTSTVERLEPQAGMATDPDPTADKVPPSVSASKAEDAPYAVGRMHDLTCAAYDPAGTLAGFPTLKTVADAIDRDWFLAAATEAMASGKTKKATRLGALVDAADTVKTADPAALADASALLHKSFSDMYPDLHITPQSGVRPGSYQRPYLAAGHASEHASDSSASIPPSAHTPEPEDFKRPLITDGHAADSPANKAAPGEGAMATTADFRTTTGAARTYYTNAQRDSAKSALQALHDHIAGSFPDLCPMASSKSVMPPDMGAGNTPEPQHPASQGGVPGVGKQSVPLTAAQQTAGPEIQQAIADAIRRHSGRDTAYQAPQPVMTRKRLEKAAARMGLDVVERKVLPAVTGAHTPQASPAGISLDEMKALLASQISPLAEQYAGQIDDLRKQVDELGARPDPAMAPVRGQLARTPEQVTPVERRSLVDEAADNANKSAAAHETRYRAYVDALTRSPDPGVREAALATMDRLNTGASAG